MQTISGSGEAMRRQGQAGCHLDVDISPSLASPLFLKGAGTRLMSIHPHPPPSASLSLLQPVAALRLSRVCWSMSLRLRAETNACELGGGGRYTVNTPPYRESRQSSLHWPCPSPVLIQGRMPEARLLVSTICCVSCCLSGSEHKCGNWPHTKASPSASTHLDRTTSAIVFLLSGSRCALRRSNLNHIILTLTTARFRRSHLSHQYLPRGTAEA